MLNTWVRTSPTARGNDVHSRGAGSYRRSTGSAGAGAPDDRVSIDFTELTAARHGAFSLRRRKVTHLAGNQVHNRLLLGWLVAAGLLAGHRPACHDGPAAGREACALQIPQPTEQHDYRTWSTMSFA